MTVLWPRLNSVHSHQLATELAALTLEELRDRSAVEHPDAAPNETGGSKVDTGKIQRLRDEALQIARECGLDHTVPASRREGPAFDRAVTRTLYETVGDNANDLWSGDVWSFITLVVLPDLAAWRFPNRTAERMVGGVMLRNTFSRLWWRAHILGCDLLDGDRHLVEDEIVTITERTSMMRHPRFLRRYARIAGKIALDSDHPRTEVMRVLAPVARRRLAFINPAVLSDDEIDEFIERSLWSVDIKKALEDRGVISVEPSEADDALDTATAPDSTDQLDEEVRTYLPVSEATKD